MLNRLTRWLQAPPGAKASRAEGASAHRAVRLVSEAAATLPLVLKSQGRELHQHPLLAQPNAREGGQRFVESLYGHLMVSGDAYVEAVHLDGTPHEVHALRPDRMRVVPDSDRWPAAFEFVVGTQAVRFAIREDEAPILHLTLFHPADDHYGLSPMGAATALDIHNAAGAWNMALLDNAARWSSAARRSLMRSSTG